MGVSRTNIRSREGSVNGEETITFDLRPRTLMITNDSISGELKFKFNTSEDYVTLRPTETITLANTGNNVIIQGLNVAYRIWGFYV